MIDVLIEFYQFRILCNQGQYFILTDALLV